MSGVLHFRSCLDGGEEEIGGKERGGIDRREGKTRNKTSAALG